MIKRRIYSFKKEWGKLDENEKKDVAKLSIFSSIAIPSSIIGVIFANTGSILIDIFLGITYGFIGIFLLGLALCALIYIIYETVFFFKKVKRYCKIVKKLFTVQKESDHDS